VSGSTTPQNDHVRQIGFSFDKDADDARAAKKAADE